MQIQEVIIRGRRDIVLATGELPDTVGSTELRLRTLTTFISAGTELSIYLGTHPGVDQPGNWGSWPWVPGYGHIGVVEEIGEQVQGFARGDRLFSFSPHRSHHLLNVATTLAVKVPDALSDVTAAAARMAVVAYAGLHVATLRVGMTVAIFGLGAVGNLCAQLFQIAGCRVVAVDLSPGRRELAKRCGIVDVIGADVDDIDRQIRDRTDGRGADITIDAVGDSRVIQQIIPLTATHGQVILLGSPRVAFTGEMTQSFRDIHFRMITLRGALEWMSPRKDPGFGLPSIERNINTIFRQIADGRLKVDPLVSHQLPPSQIREAYEGLLNDREHFTGVALTWTANRNIA